MDINVQEVIAEMERQFPKELTICIQAIQLRKYQEKENTHDQDNSDSTE